MFYESRNDLPRGESEGSKAERERLNQEMVDQLMSDDFSKKLEKVAAGKMRACDLIRVRKEGFYILFAKGWLVQKKTLNNEPPRFER